VDSNDNMYGLVLDGGSVHTTVSVYKWSRIDLPQNLEIKEVFSCDLKSGKGISTFIKNPEDVRNYLLDYTKNGTSCLEQAVSIIDNTGVDQDNRISVLLGATGGLRALNSTHPDIAGQILCNASNLLSTVVMKQQDDSCELAKVITGRQEGKLGWMTANYLLGNYQMTHVKLSTTIEDEPKEEIGALDWGGASSQITFPVDNSINNSPNIENVQFFNHTTKIFTMSNICYGQSEALKRYFVHLIHQEFLKTGKIKTILESPCQPDSKSQMYSMRGFKLFGRCTQLRDDEFETAVGKTNKSAFYKFIAKNDIQQCKKLINLQFQFDVCKMTYKDPRTCLDSRIIPNPKANTKFLAFSTYWYVVQKLNEKLNAEKKKYGDRVRIGNFNDAAEALCTEKAEGHSLLKYGHDHVQNSCFRALYMEALLSKGYHFDHWKDIRFVSTIQGKSVGWALGYILEERIPSNFSISNIEKHDNHSWFHVCKWLVLGIVLSILIIFLTISYIVSVRNCSSGNLCFNLGLIRVNVSMDRDANAGNAKSKTDNAQLKTDNVNQNSDNAQLIAESAQ